MAAVGGVIFTTMLLTPGIAATVAAGGADQPTSTDRDVESLRSP